MTDVPVESLETLRNRLNQVHISLRKLNDQIGHHNRHPTRVKLPNYGQLQNQFQVILTQLHLLTTSLDNAQVLSHTNVYPLPEFPAAQQENLLTTLLRKKPLPEIDEWINDAIEKGHSVNVPVERGDEFARWCAAKVEELQGEMQFWGFNTKEEIDELNSEEGKARKELKEQQEKEKRELENKITNGNQKPWSTNDVLRFMCQGVLPVG